MPFHDLHLIYSPDHVTISNTLLFAKELGYETVALSLAVTGELPKPLPTVPLAAISKPDNLHVLSRLTLTVSDATQNHRLSNLASNYDIVAVRPTNEKTFQHCCSNLECDLISLDFSQRLDFPLRFTTVASALQRGVRFEICYSAGIVSGNDARRNLISCATQLIRATRGRGIVVSSEAKTALGLRGPWDAINLAQVWGLPQQRAKEAICEEAGKVVRLAGLKRTSYRGVVDIIDGGSQSVGSQTRTSKSTSTTETKTILRSNTTKGTLPIQAHQGSVENANEMKRKASTTSLNVTKAPEPATTTDEPPISKKELKRRAKKARFEEKSTAGGATNAKSNGFLLQHETLVPPKPK